MFLTSDNKEIEGKISLNAHVKEIAVSLYAKFNPIYHKKTKEWKNILLKELDKKGYSDLEKKFILAEFNFAKEFHRGEKRKDNKEYYLIHPLEVVLGSKFYEEDSNGPLTEGVLDLGIKPDAIAAAITHDTLESALERHKNIPKEIINTLFKKEHKTYFKQAFSEEEYKDIKKHINKVENLVTKIFTFDKQKDNYFLYIDKFFKKKNFIFPGNEQRSKRKILRDMLETQIIKAQDKSVSNYELLNQTELQKLKSAYKTIYTANRFKSFILRNKKKLSEYQTDQSQKTLEDITRSSIAAVDRVTTILNKKYENNNYMLKRFTEIGILAKKYEKEKGFNEITIPNENAKWNKLEVFDGILYNMYKFITSEKEKAMRTYFKNIKDEQERHIKIFTYALSLKYLAEKLDNPNFVVHKFNYKYFQKIDEKEVNNYSNYEKKSNNENIAASYYNQLTT
jgi:hypothetical protein